jgi:hypothetical protein
MSLPDNSQRYRHKYLGFISLCCFVLLLALLGLWGLGIIGSWVAYVLILLCPLVYLFLIRWGYEHNDKPTANHSEPYTPSAMDMKNDQTKVRYDRANRT